MKNADLFDYSLKKNLNLSAPLASRMRPQSLADFVGQEDVVGEKSILRRAIREDHVMSMVLWGPPGSGKTTLARIIAKESKCHFFPISAVSSGVAELRQVIAKAKELRSLQGVKSMVFIDEIHRFNKAQQDAVLPFVESGLITLIGATTENPSFEVNRALLSRCRVYVLNALAEKDIERILQNALKKEGTGLAQYQPFVAEDAWHWLISQSQGDARIALNTLEYAVISAPVDETSGKRVVTLAIMEDALQHRAMIYDKNGDQHYDLISALHKSMRNSDVDASLYWLGRMIEGGEDPLYISRRLVRFAAEDIGLADPNALTQAVASYQAVHFIGMPEGGVCLAQAAAYMALAPKSASVYQAMNRVNGDIKTKSWYRVPKHLRNPVTDLMKNQGYGKGYQYAHHFENAITDMVCLPEELAGTIYFEPSSFGWEQEASVRLRELKTKKADM